MNGKADKGTISLRFKWFYGISAYGNGLIGGIISSYIMFFLSDHVLVPIAFIGALFFFAKLLDTFTTPLIGIMIDRTQTRFGKIKPWIAIGAIFMAISAIFLFQNPGLTGTSQLIYVSVFYVMWGTSGAIFYTATGSVFPTLTRNADERKKLVIIPAIGTALGDFTTVGAVFPLIAIVAATQAEGFARLAMIFAAIFLIANTFFLRNYKEQATIQSTEKLKFKDIARAIGKNDQLLVILIVNFFLNVGIFITMGTALYFFKYNLGNEDLFATFGITVGLSQVFMMTMFPRIMRRLSKKTAFQLAAATLIIGYLILFLSRDIVSTFVPIVYFGGILLYLALGITTTLMPIFYADIIDYGEWKTGERSNSTIVSIAGLIGKFSDATKELIIGIVLTFIGFAPNMVQSSFTLTGIVSLMTFIPMVVVIICLIVFTIFYKLNDGFYNQIVVDLENKK